MQHDDCKDTVGKYFTGRSAACANNLEKLIMVSYPTISTTIHRLVFNLPIASIPQLLEFLKKCYEKLLVISKLCCYSLLHHIQLVGFCPLINLDFFLNLIYWVEKLQ